MVPYLNPVEDKVDILSIDPEIQGFEKHNIVFTDISHGAIDKVINFFSNYFTD